MDFQHIVIHKGTDFDSRYPEVIRLRNGDMVAIFRQQAIRPDPGDGGRDRATHFHEDTQSRIVLVRSTDDGLTWDPSTLVIIDPVNDAQDRNLAMIAQVSSGELIVNGMRITAHLDKATAEQMGAERTVRPDRQGRLFGDRVFDSVYLVRSKDNGYTWGKTEPFSVGPMSYWTHTGKTGVVELPDGTWLLPLSGHTASDPTDRVYIARSRDQGMTWGQPSTVASDPEGKFGFHEPPLLRLSNGRLLTMLRTSKKDYLYQAFSTDDGWTWQGLKRSPLWGYPSSVVELKSGRVLCTYGHRREPFGVRAAFSYDQGETWDMEHEVVIRDDGMHATLGYPASIQLDDGGILSVYYFHVDDGICYIGGSIWSEDDALA